MRLIASRRRGEGISAGGAGGPGEGIESGNADPGGLPYFLDVKRNGAERGSVHFRIVVAYDRPVPAIRYGERQCRAGRLRQRFAEELKIDQPACCIEVLTHPAMLI